MIPWDKETTSARCPYGVTGDRLWVRETWQPLWADEDRAPPSLQEVYGWAINYVATGGVREYRDPDDGIVHRCKPAIFMPRWASRITLEMTGVRVERVQSITEADAHAEGIAQTHATKMGDGLGVQNYSFLWDQINAKRAPWASNPWVWVLEFRRLP